MSDAPLHPGEMIANRLRREPVLELVLLMFHGIRRHWLRKVLRCEIPFTSRMPMRLLRPMAMVLGVSPAGLLDLQREYDNAVEERELAEAAKELAIIEARWEAKRRKNARRRENFRIDRMRMNRHAQHSL